MVERKRNPPSSSKRPTDPGRGRLRPEEYELKIRWGRARQVTGVTSSGVNFDFESALKVGAQYPVTLTGPGMSIASTIEITRCQLAFEEGGKFFRIVSRFFPYGE